MVLKLVTFAMFCVQEIPQTACSFPSILENQDQGLLQESFLLILL